MERLYLSNNPVGDNIDENVFENLTTLTHLNLKNISVSFFDPKLFENLIKLVFLDISSNPINTIPVLPINLIQLDLSGTNVYQFGSLDLPNLKELTIEDMRNLSTVILNDFEKLRNLQVLSIKNSKKLKQLTVWQPKPHLLPELRHLDIQDCSLETLGSELRSTIDEVSVFNFQNNPWHCDCRMKWIVLINTTHNLRNKIT